MTVATKRPVLEADPEETFFVLGGEDGEPIPGRALHRSLTCGYMVSAAFRRGRSILQVRGDPDDFLQGGGHCICFHCQHVD